MQSHKSSNEFNKFVLVKNISVTAENEPNANMFCLLERLSQLRPGGARAAARRPQVALVVEERRRIEAFEMTSLAPVELVVPLSPEAKIQYFWHNY